MSDPNFLSRFARQRAVEEMITSFSPDFEEAAEIMDALMASLERRYEDELRDANECAGWWKEALENKQHRLNLQRGPDEMDLAKWKKTA